MIRTRSASEAAAEDDGLRLFVTRYWPRGHGRAECDAWLPNLGPSERLLKQFHQGEIAWPEFARAYKAEMLEGYADESGRNPRQRNAGQKYVLQLLGALARTQTLTLICSCPPDAEHCHRHLLRALILKGAPRTQA